MKITKSQLASKFNTEVSVFDQCIKLLTTEFSKNTCNMSGNSSMVFQTTVDGFHFYLDTLAHSTPMTIHSCNKVGHIVRDFQCIRDVPAELNSVKKYLDIPKIFNNNCGMFLYNTPNIQGLKLMYLLGIKYYIILNKKNEDAAIHTVMNSTDKMCIDTSRLVTEIYYIG
jgi:hypothetical protein